MVTVGELVVMGGGSQWVIGGDGWWSQWVSWYLATAGVVYGSLLTAGFLYYATPYGPPLRMRGEDPPGTPILVDTQVGTTLLPGRPVRGRASLAGWSFAEAWVAGAILAATDPVAVVTESARYVGNLCNLGCTSFGWYQFGCNYQFWLYQC